MTIIVRALEPLDIPSIFRLYSCKNTQANTLQLPSSSHIMWEKRLSAAPDNYYCFVAEDAGNIVGQLGFDVKKNPRRRHVAEFGMAVHDEHVRKGIGSQLVKAMLDLADNWINVLRIELVVFCDNEAGIALYKKFGFEIEGRALKYALRDGHYMDAFYMARLNPNQENTNENKKEATQENQ